MGVKGCEVEVSAEPGIDEIKIVVVGAGLVGQWIKSRPPLDADTARRISADMRHLADTLDLAANVSGAKR